MDAIKKRGELVCGVSQGSAGLSIADAQGRWTGLDADLCRALAAAVLGDASKTRFVPLSSQQRFPALQSGEIDVLNRNTTITSGRDAGLGIVSAGIVFYDGQGFMVPKKLGVKSAAELDGAQVCVQPGTVNEQNLVDYFKKRKLSYRPVVIENLVELEQAFYAGRCDVYLSDASTLAASRAARAANPDDFVILPERINKSPLGPFVRQDDPTGAPSCAGPSTRWWPPRNWASPPPTPTARRRARTRRCAACWARSPASARASAWTSMGAQRHQGRGQLRRGLEPQPGRGHAAEAGARPERAMEPGRPAVLAAVPMTRAGAVRRAPAARIGRGAP